MQIEAERVEARMGLAEELVDTAPIVQDTSEVIQEEDQVCRVA